MLFFGNINSFAANHESMGAVHSNIVYEASKVQTWTPRRDMLSLASISPMDQNHRNWEKKKTEKRVLSTGRKTAKTKKKTFFWISVFC